MSMKILEAKAELVQDKSYPGLFDCKLTHKIKETSAAFHYTGPKFSPQMWSEILAFFKWSYAKTHGESQVRLFVHPAEGWKAWAFPQGASSGLATTELPDNPETKAQRAQFGDDWILYGTVHHHCSISAFQSGTDTHNEQDQEGIHITVGDMDKDVHSLHCRFYYQGCKFQPDMGDFWDVGEDVRSDAKIVLARYNISIDLNQQAEIQMKQTCPKDTAFPDQWMANLIEKKWPVTTVGDIRGEYWGARGTSYNGVEDPGFKGYPTRAIKALRKSYRKAYKEDIKAAGGLTIEIRGDIDDEIASLLDHIVDDKEITYVLELAERHQTSVEDIARKFTEIVLIENSKEPPIDQKEIEEELKDEQNAPIASSNGGVTGVGNGNDYGGYGCT